MRANREAKEAADRKRREEDAAEDAKWAAKEAEDRRRREEGERAKKQAEQQRLDDLYAQQEADAKKRRNRRHEERTTPLRSPAPRSPRQPPSAQLRSPGSPAVVNTQARRTPPASPPVPSLAAQKVPAALVRASAAPGTKISDDDLERAASDFEARVAAELERFQDDRRRRVARAALPQNAGGALEALAEKIQQAPDLRTLAGLPPAARPGRRRRRRPSSPRTTGARRRSRASRRSCRCPSARAPPRRPTTRGHAAGLGRRALARRDRRPLAARPPATRRQGAPRPRRANVAAPKHRRAVPRRRVVLPRVHRPRRRGHHLARAAGDVRGPRGPDPRRVV